MSFWWWAESDAPGADKWMTFYEDLLKGIKPGVTLVIVHLGFDDGELRGVMTEKAPFGAAWRQRDFDTVSSPRFIQALKDNRDHVRYMAAKGLRDLGDSDSVEPMIILLRDENRYVRMMAARALGVIGGTKVTEALNTALTAEKDEKVKEAIAEALK